MWLACCETSGSRFSIGAPSNSPRYTRTAFRWPDSAIRIRPSDLPRGCIGSGPAIREAALRLLRHPLRHRSMPPKAVGQMELHVDGDPSFFARGGAFEVTIARYPVRGRALPSTDSSPQPKVEAAPGLHKSTRPWPSIPTIASANIAASVSSCLGWRVPDHAFHSQPGARELP